MTSSSTPQARYAELHAHSAFSFLDGVSQPAAMVERAAQLGLEALAITDHDGLYAVVQQAQAAREVGIGAVFGAELTLDAGPEDPNAPDPQGTHLVVLARGAQGYANLSRAIAEAYLRVGHKGSPLYDLDRLAELAAGEWLILTGCRKGAVRRALERGCREDQPPERWDMDGARQELEHLTALFGKDNVAVEINDAARGWDSARCDALASLAASEHLPLVASGNVHYATPAQYPLSSALGALSSRRSVLEADPYLPASPTSFLRSASEMMQRHWRHPQAVLTAAELGRECAFDLHLIAPNLPPYDVPAGHTEATWLRELVKRGAARRYGSATPEVEKARGVLERELGVIEQLNFPGYFLIVHDLVDFCRNHGILCQGRGSAANSAVCYALGITAVDPVSHGLLFERFLAPERDGPPDIDIDIESERREEVIQYVYAKHGRERSALVANVISYRPKMAIRDAAKALGYDPGQADSWSKNIERGWTLYGGQTMEIAWGTRDAEPHPSGDDLESVPADVMDLAESMMRLPRHMGIHPGGMVLCDRPIVEVCPVQWGRMADRTILQWDKDDCADAGLVKFDLLGLGMLGAIRLAFEMVEKHEGEHWELHSLPQEDAAVYDLLCAADTVGVFQVESRAQMATLPRLRPRCFYDIVIEVALIRPGPIQGKSVHPYIERSQGREPVTYDHELLRPALEKTLGVPLFQEQLMRIAIDAAGFSAAEADQLRRAMGSKRSPERMLALHDKLIAGMGERGIDREAAERIYEKLRAFADFGFPESHSFSFAYIVYASAWLKVYHPAAFYAGLLGAQPMGFYSPQSLIADARHHGLVALRPDVTLSSVNADLEWQKDDLAEGGESRDGNGRGDGHNDGGGHNGDDDNDCTEWREGVAHPPLPQGFVGPAPQLVRANPRLSIRLGLAQIRGIGEKVAERIVAERKRENFSSMSDLARRCHLTSSQMESLATAGALKQFDADRRRALWASGPASQMQQGMLEFDAMGARAPDLPAMDSLDTAVADAWATNITVDSYPTQYVRSDLEARGILTVRQVLDVRPGSWIHVGGVVTHRQRPGTAKGVTFLSLEDETGLLNVVCSRELWTRQRQVARTSRALVITGQAERADGVTNLRAVRLEPLSLRIPTKSRDFQ